LFFVFVVVIKDALNLDLNTIRSEYEQQSESYRQLQKQFQKFQYSVDQHHHQHRQSNQSTSLSSTSTAGGGGGGGGSLPSTIGTNNTIVSVINSPNSGPTSPLSLQQQTRENENLEEDMRKAKESADMLRSVVLPLETEIVALKTRSDTSDSRVKELEQLIEKVNSFL
jgi:septal ring factor EnvC (AmiA/AmiB activator)